MMSMSGGAWNYNRFDSYEKTLSEKKADKDYDGDGKVESSKDEYFGSKDKAIKKAMGKDTKKESKDDDCECNEEFEQLDELSKGTMGSYVKKASKDVEKRSYTQGSTDAEDAEIGYPGQTPKDKKIDKRQKGIGKAVDKMTRKEETDPLSDAYASMYQEGLSVEDQMKASQGYFKKRNARSPEEKAAEEKAHAKSRAERSAMHKKPDPYKSRPGESD